PRTTAPTVSGLSLLINAKQNTHTDPLEARFGALDGKAEPEPLMLKLYRPTGVNPSKPFSVCIKPSATVFETIGFVLLKYLESEQQPALTEEQRDPDCWTLRIVEDDGELDEDFPALDRTRPISKFSFDEFALVEATPAQMEEYKQSQGTSTPTKSTRHAHTPAEHLPPPDPAFLSPERSSHPGSSSLSSAKPGATLGQPTKSFAKTPGTPDQTTILNVTTETYLGDVLDQVCRRRNLDKYMYLLRLASANVIVPTDRTIESLQGRTELVLIRKRARDILHDPGMPRSMTPNAPIVAAPFAYSASKLGTSAVVQGDASLVPDFVNANTYQRWIVWRRQPMSFMGRHERMLAIDGEYVHISPTESKTMFENAKTSSLHVGQIVVCKQSRRIPMNFKIIIIKQGQTKRYDFEASSIKESEVIVSRIRTLM
ncbi:stress-activated map kinase interacting protein 1-domain-containing protein, partial [Protomyces lactucae-debilis]